MANELSKTETEEKEAGKARTASNAKVYALHAELSSILEDVVVKHKDVDPSFLRTALEIALDKWSAKYTTGHLTRQRHGGYYAVEIKLDVGGLSVSGAIGSDGYSVAVHNRNVFGDEDDS